MLQVALKTSNQISSLLRNALIQFLKRFSIQVNEQSQIIFVVVQLITQRSLKESYIEELFNSIDKDSKAVLVCLISTENEENFGNFERKKPSKAIAENLYFLTCENTISNSIRFFDRNCSIINGLRLTYKNIRLLGNNNNNINIYNNNIQINNMNIYNNNNYNNNNYNNNNNNIGVNQRHETSKSILDYCILSFNADNMIPAVQQYLYSQCKIRTTVVTEIQPNTVTFVLVYFTNPRSPSELVIEKKFKELICNNEFSVMIGLINVSSDRNSEMTFIHSLAKPPRTTWPNIYLRYCEGLSKFSFYERNNIATLHNIISHLNRSFTPQEETLYIGNNEYTWPLDSNSKEIVIIENPILISQVYCSTFTLGIRGGRDETLSMGCCNIL